MLPKGRAQWLAFAGAAGVSALSAVAFFALRDDNTSSKATDKPKIVSGAPAFRQSSAGKELRWHARNMTVYLDKSLDSLDPGAKNAIQLGFGSWLAADSKLPALKFDTISGSRLSQKPDGKSTVYVAPIDIPGHEQDLALTITFSREDTGEIVEADLVFNSNYKFGVLDTVPVSAATTTTSASNPNSSGKSGTTTGANNGNNDKKATTTASIDPRHSEQADPQKCGQRYDIQNVATHEVGHFFGLGEDPTETDATMFKRVSRCEVHKRLLASTDETAVLQLYAKQETEETATTDTGQGCGGARLGMGTLPGTYAALGIGLGLVLFGRARRRRSA
jgi:hypothetical protein